MQAHVWYITAWKQGGKVDWAAFWQGACVASSGKQGHSTPWTDSIALSPSCSKLQFRWLVLYVPNKEIHLKFISSPCTICIVIDSVDSISIVETGPENDSCFKDTVRETAARERRVSTHGHQYTGITSIAFDAWNEQLVFEALNATSTDLGGYTISMRPPF